MRSPAISASDQSIGRSSSGQGLRAAFGLRPEHQAFDRARRAAPLVDHVFPKRPYAAGVLSPPQRLRYVLAWDHALYRAVTGVSVRAVLGSLCRRARQAGVPGRTGGAVAIIQRFGAALNLNVPGLSRWTGPESRDVRSSGPPLPTRPGLVRRQVHHEFPATGRSLAAPVASAVHITRASGKCAPRDRAGDALRADATRPRRAE